MITAMAYKLILENAGLYADIALNGHPRIIQWLSPVTPEQEAQADALLLNARPVEFEGQTIFSGSTIVTVRCSADVAEIALLVRGVPVVVALANGLGSLEITAQAPTLPPHILVEAQDKTIFGYATLTLEAV